MAAAPKEQQLVVIDELVLEKEEPKRSDSLPCKATNEQHRDNDGISLDPLNDANALPRSDDVSLRRRWKDANELAKAILRDFCVSDVRLIVTALSIWLAKRANGPVSSP